jgi:hypothetical protein
MPKRLVLCQSCGKPTGEYQENGYFRCTDDQCGAVWWGPSDKPSSKEGPRGIKCYQCRNKKTMLPITRLDNVEVYRCTICGCTLLTH